jgi:hypothetical protein
MPEHFRTLQKIIDSGRAHKVKLLYNTNMTKLNYNRHDLVEYWKQFRNVVLGASIDAMGERAEFIRNGVKWSAIEKNLKTLSDTIQEHRHINIHIAPTVSIMNVHSLTDMHRYFVENKYVPDVNAVVLNMLLGPSYYEIRNLSDKLKDEVKEKVALHCDWLREKNARPDIIESFNSIISYISNDASTDDIAKFVQETRKIDERRGQSFPDTFPEYSQWWEEIDNSLIRVNSI